MCACFRSRSIDGHAPVCCVVLLQERLGIDRLEFRLAECDDIGDEAASHMGACAPEKGHGRETFSKKLGRFLRDPSVWCAGFQLQWKKNKINTN